MGLGSRAHFPELQFAAYLAHAAISPAHLGQQAAVQRALTDLAHFGAAAFPAYQAQRERLREGLAQLLSVPVRQVALTPGTTRSITDIALSLPLSESDELVLFRGEFPANVLPWSLAAREVGAKVTLLEAPSPRRPDLVGGILEDVEKRLKRGARYVAVSAVQFQTGLQMPTAELGALCRRYSAHLLVDGIQAVGPVPTSPREDGMSFLAGGAHKWLLGSEGAGYCYLSEELRQELRPKTLGWLSYEGGERFLFEGGPELLRYDLEEREDASVFEGSTASLLSFVAMEAGVDLVRAVGPEAIFQHTQAYHDAIESRIEALGFRSVRGVEGTRSAILSFLPPEGVLLKDLSMELRKRGVMMSTPAGHLRLAPHFSNSLAEVEGVCSALEEALRALRD